MESPQNPRCQRENGRRTVPRIGDFSGIRTVLRRRARDRGKTRGGGDSPPPPATGGEYSLAAVRHASCLDETVEGSSTRPDQSDATVGGFRPGTHTSRYALNSEQQSKGPVLWAIVLLAAGLVTVVAMLRSSDEREPLGSSEESPAGSPVHEGLATPETPAQATGAIDRVAGESEELAPIQIYCLQASNRQPLAGVRLYERHETISGPTGTDGVLPVGGDRRGELTLWVQGWLPVVVRGEGLPEEVLFVVADASIELRLLNATAEHRVVRILLQPHSSDWAPGDPWAPTLGPKALDVYGASHVPPGEYDLYAWVSLAQGEPRPFSLTGVEVVAGEKATFSLDLAAPVDPEDQESDS